MKTHVTSLDVIIKYQLVLYGLMHCVYHNLFLPYKQDGQEHVMHAFDYESKEGSIKNQMVPVDLLPLTNGVFFLIAKNDKETYTQGSACKVTLY